MKVLVDIIHPAHVHFFRNAIDILQQKGHEVAVTAREKDVTIDLLNEYNIPYTVLSKMGRKKFALAAELVTRDARLLKFCLKFKPDVLTGISGIFAAHVGFVIRRPSVVWDDTEHQKYSHMITYPFANSFNSPDCYKKTLGKKQSLYAGCHELAYLHPNYFTPDKELVRSLGIDPDQKYCVIRFVSWQAHHDIGQHGFDNERKLEFIKEISKHARPYICPEGQLPEELKPYLLDIPVHRIHHVLAFASLCVGEGATMVSESAVLGVPAVYINTLPLGYIDMLEKYGILNQTTDTQKALDYSLDWLTNPDAQAKCGAIREKFLSEKIDVTEHIVNTLEKFGQRKR